MIKLSNLIGPCKFAAGHNSLLLTAGLLAVSLTAGQTASADLPSQLRPEYTPPADWSTTTAHNGELIAPATPISLPYTIDRAASVELLLYRSRSAHGEAIPASATLIKSTANHAGVPHPLVAFAPGTQGMANECASSVLLRSALFYELPPLIALLQKGFDVVIPDFEGLGVIDGKYENGTFVDKHHTFVVNRSNGQTTLDALRAARAQLGVSTQKLGIFGYSEGGGAAAWAAAYADEYAADLTITAVAAGGVAADGIAMGKLLNYESLPATSVRPGYPIAAQPVRWYGIPGNPYASLLLMAGVAYDSVYPELDVWGKLHQQGTAWARKAAKVCLVEALGISAFQGLDYSLKPGIENNVLLHPLWIDRFDDNNPGFKAPTVPVFLYHGRADDSVAFQQAVVLRERWCDQNANVHWRRYNGNHIDVWGVYASPITYLQQQFFGNTSPYPNNCADQP